MLISQRNQLQIALGNATPLPTKGNHTNPADAAARPGSAGPAAFHCTLRTYPADFTSHRRFLFRNSARGSSLAPRLLRRGLDQDARDVVVPAGLLGRFDEPGGALLQRHLFAEKRLDRLVGKLPRQPV